jgi:hypothetical protein
VALFLRIFVQFGVKAGAVRFGGFDAVIANDQRIPANTSAKPFARDAGWIG